MLWFIFSIPRAMPVQIPNKIGHIMPLIDIPNCLAAFRQIDLPRVPNPREPLPLSQNYGIWHA
ncbi:hypothetical protein [Candidatus Methylomicrobium oryzae]|uniref:hypothetical protein n=1 Tax=Candidatus Methylomicrobium oryzae TaxID=2802053 RepID=UPI0019215A69|nr:hypothetical protein [Methylomicrobium sp. RS1]